MVEGVLLHIYLCLNKLASTPRPLTVGHTPIAVDVDVDVFQELLGKEASTCVAHAIAHEPCDRGQRTFAWGGLTAEDILLIESHHGFAENLLNE